MKKFVASYVVEKYEWIFWWVKTKHYIIILDAEDWLIALEKARETTKKTYKWYEILSEIIKEII